MVRRRDGLGPSGAPGRSRVRVAWLGAGERELFKMTNWTCGACATVNAIDDSGCMTCGQGRPAVPLVAAPPALLAGGGPAVRTDPGAVGPNDVVPPAAARSAMTPGPTAVATHRSPSGDGHWPGSRLALVALAVVAVAALAGGAIYLARSGGEAPTPHVATGRDGEAGGRRSSATGDRSPAGSTEVDPLPSTTDPAPIVTAVATTTPMTTTVPASDAVPDGSWILVLDSIPWEEGSAGALALQDAYRTQGYDTIVIDTADHPMLRQRYWAVVVNGAWPTKAEARLHCDLVGRVPGSDCYERQIR